MGYTKAPPREEQDMLIEYLDAIIEAMEPVEKESLTNQIRDLLQSLLSKGLAEEEIAVLIMEEIVIPEIEKKKDQDAQLAFAHKTSKFYQ